MGDSKLSFKVGAVEFTGEGESNWLASQLDKIIEAAEKLSVVAKKVAPVLNGKDDVGEDDGGETPTTTLASYLRNHGADTKQVRRFLVTADWLRRRGEKKLTTALVTKALADNHQKRLGNPADSLNQNVGRGFCEKNGEGFFITPEGLAEIAKK